MGAVRWGRLVRLPARDEQEDGRQDDRLVDRRPREAFARAGHHHSDRSPLDDRSSVCALHSCTSPYPHRRHALEQRLGLQHAVDGRREAREASRRPRSRSVDARGRRKLLSGLVRTTDPARQARLDDGERRGRTRLLPERSGTSPRLQHPVRQLACARGQDTVRRDAERASGRFVRPLERDLRIDALAGVGRMAHARPDRVGHPHRRYERASSQPHARILVRRQHSHERRGRSALPRLRRDRPAVRERRIQRRRRRQPRLCTPGRDCRASRRRYPAGNGCGRRAGETDGGLRDVGDVRGLGIVRCFPGGWGYDNGSRRVDDTAGVRGERPRRRLVGPRSSERPLLVDGRTRHDAGCRRQHDQGAPAPARAPAAARLPPRRPVRAPARPAPARLPPPRPAPARRPPRPRTWTSSRRRMPAKPTESCSLRRRRRRS